MEYLIRAEAHLPDSMEQARRDDLLGAELQRGVQLHEQGILKRIWRLPGRRANVSLYDAANADQLHAILTSLPLWPWLTITVEALCEHPVEASRRQTGRADD